MRLKKIIVNTSDGKYPILIGKNVSFDLGNLLRQNNIFSSKILLVIDKNVPRTMVRKIKISLKKKKIFYLFKIQ